MFATEPIGRGVLDACLRGYDDLLRRDARQFAPNRCCTMTQATTTTSVSRRLPVTHAAASLSKCKPDSVNDLSRFGPTFAPLQNVWLTRERRSHSARRRLQTTLSGRNHRSLPTIRHPRRCDLFAMGPRATRLFNLWGYNYESTTFNCRSAFGGDRGLGGRHASAALQGPATAANGVSGV